jgi:hypothetical protein
VTLALLPATPEVIVRFGSGAIFQNSFTLGTSEGVLGVNVLGVQRTVPVPRVQQISIRRGKASVDGSFGAGSAAIQFIDVNGDWNPTDPGGEYAGEIFPGRQIQIRVTDDTNTGINLFAGYVTAWDWQWSPGQAFANVTINAADASRQLELAEVTTVPGAAAGQLPGTRINLILDEREWPVTARNVTDGTTTLQNDPGDTRSTLAALRQVEQSDLGALFVDTAGRITYLSRNTLSTRAVGTPVVFNETNAPYTRLDVALDDDQIANDVTVTPKGLTAQEAVNTVSQTKYFRRSLARTDQLMETETKALQQATAIAASRGEANLTLKSVAFNVDSMARMKELAAVEIGDPLSVTRSYTGSPAIEFNSIVQGINWDIVPNQWRGTFSTTDTLALTTSFVLGSAQFGVLGNNSLG